MSILNEAIIGLEFGGLDDQKHVLGRCGLNALTRHIRNRLYHDAVVPTLVWAHKQFANMQTPVDLLAFRLRNVFPCLEEQNQALLKKAKEFFERIDMSGVPDNHKILYRLNDARRRCYAAYLGMAPEDADVREFGLSQVPALWMGDITLGAEMSELAAFGAIHVDNEDEAQSWFDNAATQFYLAGLEHAGELNEWAANNIEEMSRFARRLKPSLIIPHETERLKIFGNAMANAK